jgi:hypothetical protein
MISKFLWENPLNFWIAKVFTLVNIETDLSTQYLIRGKRYIYINIGFEVLATMVTKISIVCDITPCNPLKFNRRFGGTCHLHLQSQRIHQARHQHKTGSIERTWRRHVLQTLRLSFKTLHGVIAQKLELYLWIDPYIRWKEISFVNGGRPIGINGKLKILIPESYLL